MDLLHQYDPALLESFAKLITALFAIISGIIAGIWAVIRFLNDRKKERNLKQEIELKKLEQQKIDEQGRRAERVTSLLLEFGKTSEQEIKVWTMLALSLYPEETTRLLSMSLGQFSDKIANGIQLALVRIGERALPELIKLNRIAQLAANTEKDADVGLTESLYDSNKLLLRSQSVILQLMRHLDTDIFLKYDLSELDFAGCNFNDFVMKEFSLPKCRLDGAIFKRANIRKSNFRGASINGTIFTKASLNYADFTEAEGQIIAIKSFLDGTCFDFAKIQNSNFDAASLRKTSFMKSRLEESSFNGAQMHEASIHSSHFGKVIAKKIRANKLQATGTIFTGGDFSDGLINESSFDRCKMMGMNAVRVHAKKSKFVNCNLGGTDFSGANLAGSEFKGCILGGTNFRNTDLTDCIFPNCQRETAIFDNNKNDQV